MNETLREGEPAQFVIRDQECKAVDKLECCFVESHVMASMRSSEQYLVDTDASDLQLGCVFLQEQEDKVLNPIEYR